jgi:hypothetical protein
MRRGAPAGSEREQKSRAASLSAPARPERLTVGEIDARAGADNPSGRGDPLRGASFLSLGGSAEEDGQGPTP